MSFTTNRNARGLSKGRTGLVGCTIPYVLGDYYASILSGATEALHEQEMRAVLCPTKHEHDREAALVERLLRGTTDGAIFVLPSESAEELGDLESQGFPFVVKLIARTTSMTASRVSWETSGLSFTTRDTVATDTPARRATSRIVARLARVASLIADWCRSSRNRFRNADCTQSTRRCARQCRLRRNRA
jgi:hypothetical protein